MANLWQAPPDIKRQLESIRDDHHPHLANAGLWALCSDSPGVRDNHVVATQSKRCTKTEKLSTGHDFKIIIMTDTWSKLTDAQRQIALDEALCRCGVKRIPQTVEINGRKEVVKDDLGRVIYTDEIDYDRDGEPKWKINPPDAGLFYALLARHGRYCEPADNVTRAIDHKPLKLPHAADRADILTEELEHVA